MNSLLTLNQFIISLILDDEGSTTEEEDGCGCHSDGTADSTCDAETGQCQCLCGIQGLKCDECIDFHWNFPNCEDNGLYFLNYSWIIHNRLSHIQSSLWL